MILLCIVGNDRANAVRCSTRLLARTCAGDVGHKAGAVICQICHWFGVGEPAAKGAEASAQ